MLLELGREVLDEVFHHRADRRDWRASARSGGSAISLAGRDLAVRAAAHARKPAVCRTPIFGLHTRDFRLDWIEALPTAATDHRWRLYIRHKPGALAAAVGEMRARNFAVSFGILMLLAGSILVLVLTTRRSQRWARLQLEYVARIAHELRTPLAVIGVASENLADSVVSDLPTARKYGEMINQY